jgi:hypothetical protein
MAAQNIRDVTRHIRCLLETVSYLSVIICGPVEVIAFVGVNVYVCLGTIIGLCAACTSNL